MLDPNAPRHVLVQIHVEAYTKTFLCAFGPNMHTILYFDMKGVGSNPTNQTSKQGKFPIVLNPTKILCNSCGEGVFP